MESRYQVIKVWSQVLIRPRETTLTSAAFAPGSAVRDPFTGKIFLVP